MLLPTDGQIIDEPQNLASKNEVDNKIESSKIDSDGDGMSDEFEKSNGLNPTDPTDADTDIDGDGLSNLEEIKAGTDVSNPDTDGDGQSDAAEVLSSTNPNDDSSKFDDTDGDGMSDNFENSNGLDSNDPSDADADNDGDGLSNLEEMNAGTDVSNSDTDGDGQSDAAEILSSSNPNDVSNKFDDTDTDGMTDNFDESNSLGSSNTENEVAEKIIDEVSKSDEMNSETNNLSPSSNSKPNQKLSVSNTNSSSNVSISSFKSGDNIYYFNSGSSYINANNKLLNNVVNELLSTSSSITLVGHTDNSGPEGLNNILSLDRANQVSNYFINKGISKSRITTKGQGELEPLFTNDSEENKRKNRRVKIIFYK